MTDVVRVLDPFADGWAEYQRLLLDAIGPLNAEQLAISQILGTNGIASLDL